jgi:hypothetical protein
MLLQEACEFVQAILALMLFVATADRRLLALLLPFLLWLASGVLGAPVGAQSFSVWASVTGATMLGDKAALRGTLSAGLGSNLPLGLGTLGAEIELGQTSDSQSLRGMALVLRDLGIPLLPLSLRGEAGIEQFGLRGNFEGAPVIVYVGAGLRYTVFWPFGIFAGVRSYVIGAPPGGGTLAIQLGLDLKF